MARRERWQTQLILWIALPRCGSGNEEVRKMTLFARRNGMTISLLIYPNDGPDKLRGGDLDELRALDPYDQFASNGRS